MEQTCIFRLADSRTVEQSSFLEIDSKHLFYIREEKTWVQKDLVALN